MSTEKLTSTENERRKNIEMNGEGYIWSNGGDENLRTGEECECGNVNERNDKVVVGMIIGNWFDAMQ